MNGSGTMMTTTSAAEERRWAAVAARAADADGAFVYGVRSTMIYCRPVCPSRRPARGGVAFFDGPAEAERAGYRACKRCVPRAVRSPLAERVAAVRAACARIDASEQPPVLAELAAASGLSRYHFLRLFTATVGVTPRAYAASRRTARLQTALARAPRVADAAYDAGFGSASAFYDDAAATLGMAPRAYRAGGAGETIAYALVETALGRALIATTARGVCAILFGDDDAALERELAERFPRAERRRDDTRLAPLVARLVAGLAEPAHAAALPLDVRGTAFQRRVWSALRAIPPGETRSYGEIAAALGLPHGGRAVARACATNPVALAIPCHRVRRADGSPAGYRWGLARKRALLERERR